MEIKTIKFYNQHAKPYGVFSNFSPHPILLQGKEWPTTEHYFQVNRNFKFCRNI